MVQVQHQLGLQTYIPNVIVCRGFGFSEDLKLLVSKAVNHHAVCSTAYVVDTHMQTSTPPSLIMYGSTEHVPCITSSTRLLQAHCVMTTHITSLLTPAGTVAAIKTPRPCQYHPDRPQLQPNEITLGSS